MFTVYCLYPGDEDVTKITDVDEKGVQENIDKAELIIERFAFLSVLYRVVVDTSYDFLNYKVKSHEHFWKCIKYQMNYVNALYGFKEYVKYNYGEKSNEYKLIDDHYNRIGWYTFAMHYRNIIIHRAGMVRDYLPKTGDVFIDLDKIIDETKKDIDRKKKQKKKKYNEEHDRNFIRFVENQFSDCVGNGNYYSAKKALLNANTEIYEIAKDVFHYIYQHEYLPVMEYLIGIVVKDPYGEYVPTYVVNQETGKQFAVHEYLEDMLWNHRFTLGSEFGIVQDMLRKFYESKYLYFNSKDVSLLDIQKDVSKDSEKRNRY